MIESRNFKVSDMELNWARLDEAVNPFGTEQYELQIATTSPEKAQELRDNHFNVKEKDGKFTVALKRKAKKANGEDNGKVRVVDANLAPMTNVSSIGNGSTGSVIVFQFPYDIAGKKGVASSLQAVQVSKLEIYSGSDAVAFEVVGEAETGSVEEAVNMF